MSKDTDVALNEAWNVWTNIKVPNPDLKRNFVRKTERAVLDDEKKTHEGLQRREKKLPKKCWEKC